MLFIQQLAAHLSNTMALIFRPLQRQEWVTRSPLKKQLWQKQLN